MHPLSHLTPARNEIMEPSMQEFVLDIIEHDKDLTLASIRPDGYSQAMTIIYAHDDALPK
jgi:hypothetical protein